MLWLFGLALFAGAIALSWNGSLSWMDAEGYAVTIALRRSVVHPPGHILFVAMGRLLYAIGFRDCVGLTACAPPERLVALAHVYTVLQVLTLLSTLAGMFWLYRLLREVTGPIQSSFLVLAFALSWIPLSINHTGTSHASDLFTTPLLLWAAGRMTTRPTRAAAAVFAMAVVLCSGFRFTTLIMMGPLLLAVVWVNRRNPRVWIAFLVAGVLVGLLQILTIQMYGGWASYAGAAGKMNHVNGSHSVIAAGFTRPAILNLASTILWFVIATMGLWFGLFRLRSACPWNAKRRIHLVFGALAAAGPVAVCGLYLCEHPGYLAPALAGFYLCVAVAWDRAGERSGFAKWPMVAVATSLLLYFGMHYYRTPATRGQAAANALLLQFSADGARHAYYVSPFGWLQ